MANKKKEAKDDFNIIEALEEYPLPDWYKRAFAKTMDLEKIKSKADLDKAFKTYGEMK